MREDNICIWVSDDSDGIRPPPCLSLNKIKKAISWVPLQLQLVANETGQQISCIPRGGDGIYEYNMEYSNY